MARRSCASATINFGLVSIPVKFYLAAQSVSVGFNLLAPETKNRVEQLYRDKVTKEILPHAVLVKGFEHKKDEYVVFTPEELKDLCETDNGGIDIKEFVAAEQVDLLHVEKSYHLSPGKGGDKAYTLLVAALKKTNQYAVAQWKARGKQHLVVIRPYTDGLVIHQMFYANEVRDYDSDLAKVNVSDAEVNMACMLIGTLKSEKYDASKYVDSYPQRVQDAVQTKLNTGSAVVASDVQGESSKHLDLFAALKASLESQAAKA